MKNIVLIALAVSVATLKSAAFGIDFHDIQEVVHVMTPGGLVRMNKSDYKPEVHGDIHPDPFAGMPASIPAAAPVAGVPLAASGDVAPIPAPAPAPVAPAAAYKYADPVSRPIYVLQIGDRWFMTDATGAKFQKGQSATGYATQDEANGKATAFMQADQTAGKVVPVGEKA